MLFLALALHALGCPSKAEPRKELLGRFNDTGEIFALNAEVHSPKDLVQCVREIIERIDKGEIQKYKTIISAEHTLVREALSGRSILVLREGKDNVLFLLAGQGNKLILYKNDKYVLYGLNAPEVWTCLAGQ